MRAALVLHSVFLMVFSSLIFFVRAKQVRREMDERMASAHVHVEVVPMEKMGSNTSGESTGSIEKEEKNQLMLERGDLIPSLEGVHVKVEDVGIVTHPDSRRSLILDT